MKYLINTVFVSVLFTGTLFFSSNAVNAQNPLIQAHCIHLEKIKAELIHHHPEHFNKDGEEHPYFDKIDELIEFYIVIPTPSGENRNLIIEEFNAFLKTTKELLDKHKFDLRDPIKPHIENMMRDVQHWYPLEHIL